MRFIPPFGWARFVSEVLLTDVAVRNRFTGGAGCSAHRADYHVVPRTNLQV